MLKRIYINREAILKNREAGAMVRTDIITVAYIDLDKGDDPTDTRQGCDRGALQYDTGEAVIIHGPSTVVHDPDMKDGASVWVETVSPVSISR